MSDGRIVCRVLEGSADLTLVEQVLDAVEGLSAPLVPVPEMDHMLFMVAVSEIMTNIATHSSSSVDAHVELQAGAGMLRAVIRDTAPPADISWDSVQLADVDAESGRGLALTLSTLDEFRHEAHVEGNTWVLERRFSDVPG